MQKLIMLQAYLSRFPVDLEALGDWSIETENDEILVNATDEGFEISEDWGDTWKPLETVTQLKKAIADMNAQWLK